jgi:hypothetical protein
MTNKRIKQLFAITENKIIALMEDGTIFQFYPFQNQIGEIIEYSLEEVEQRDLPGGKAN